MSRNKKTYKKFLADEAKLIKDNELKKMKVFGGGGTTLQPMVDLLVKKYNNYPTILYTDGYCDNLDFKGIKNEVLILTTKKMVEHSNGGVKVRQFSLKE